MDIILVEDKRFKTKNDKKNLQKIIDNFDYKVYDNGITGLFYIKYYKPKIVILEQRIPELSGIKIAEDICYLYNPIIILISEDENVVKLRDTYKKYINYTLTKPLDPCILKRILTAKNDSNLFSARYIKQKNMDRESLKMIIKNELKTVHVKLDPTSINFLVNAVDIYMKPERQNLYRELAFECNMGESNAFRKLKRITMKVNRDMKNTQLIAELSSEVLKRC